LAFHLTRAPEALFLGDKLRAAVALHESRSGEFLQLNLKCRGLHGHSIILGGNLQYQASRLRLAKPFSHGTAFFGTMKISKFVGPSHCRTPTQHIAYVE